MNHYHPTLPLVPAPLPPALRELIREQARMVLHSPVRFTAFRAAQGIVGRACASDGERAAAMDELSREVRR